MKQKVCHIFSSVNQGRLFLQLLDFMDPQKYEISFIMIAEKENDFFKELKSRGCELHFVRYNGRLSIFKSVFEMTRILKKSRPDIVHTHLLIGSLVGLIAAKLAGIKKRVSYRHHSNEAHVYFPHGVYYDKIINRLSQRIVANTRITAEVLIQMEHVPLEKVTVINFGFDFESMAVSEKEVEALKTDYQLEGRSPIIGVVSRFTHWKGIQHIIPAAAKLFKEYPNGKLVLANAYGPNEVEIKSLLREQLDPTNYILIPFEQRMNALFRTFGVFVHAPIDKYCEAFGQIYIEALAMGIPSVFTLSGIANDFIVHGENAILVPYCDTDAIYAGIKKLLDDESLRRHIANQGRKDVERLFPIEKFAADLDLFYSQL